MSVKSTGHLNLHACENPEGGWEVEIFFLIFITFFNNMEVHLRAKD